MRIISPHRETSASVSQRKSLPGNWTDEHLLDKLAYFVIVDTSAEVKLPVLLALLEVCQA